MQGEVQPALKAQRVRESLRNLLLQVQMRSSWDFRKQRGVRQVLHRYDHPRQSDQVPLAVASVDRLYPIIML